jgi:hypothetical protein
LGTFGTLATPPENDTFRLKPLGHVTMIDVETLGSVSRTLSVPPDGDGFGLGFEEDEEEDEDEDAPRREDELGRLFLGLGFASGGSPESSAAAAFWGLFPRSATGAAGCTAAGTSFSAGGMMNNATRTEPQTSNIRPTTATYMV